MKIFLNIFITILFFDFGHLITLLQPRVLVQEGCSYFQMVTDTNLAISKCQASFKWKNVDVNVQMDLHNNNITFNNNFKDSINLKNRITSLGFGRCGFKIDNVTLKDPENWTFMVTNSIPDKIFNASFTVGIYKATKLHSTRSVTLGEISSITCGIEYTQRLYCYLYNPQGKFITNECVYNFRPFIEDIGTWTCDVIVTQSPQALKYTIDVKLQGKSTTHDWVDETDDYVSFGCRIKNWNRYKPPEHCIMTSPIGEKFIIKPGHATLRYTSVYTNLNENICGIEIKKPLMDSEKGFWTCDIGDRGKVIFIGNKNDTSIKNVKIDPIEVAENKMFTFNCKVQDSYSNCFIVTPTGNRLSPNVKPTRSELGECTYQFTYIPLLKDINGTWKCYFIKEDELIAFEQQQDVIVRKSFTCDTIINTKIDKEVSMSCKSGRQSIDYCWFISPSGKTYHVKPGFRNFKYDNVSYFGKGLEYGECGLKIFHLKNDDIGKWKCVFKMNGSKYDETIKINLK